ncbi:MAG TPA: ribosome small subunit-dependent GTPase A [Syntrophomonadaceae bacterium]|nr:ribosome small subunit-dependent GTPase A [Syntrophomonadaceae bacterium]HNX29013.1 ribosome small subunit-dependent GTPase A [Syntrophomonadaceae bacterium]HPR93769.1 ribosome small subunit-dependent GTPase A [Syntrophomonadaceae bacterium]
MPEFRQGMVIKNYSGFYYVKDESGDIFACKPRGKLKTWVLSGDQVNFTPLNNNQGVLEDILPRKNEMTRPKIANVDIVLIVMAHDKPAPNLLLLDRLLLLVYYNRITPYIILNKADLPKSQKAECLDYYRQAGFNFISASVKTGLGIDKVAEAVKDKIAVLAGPSGAGKSSMLVKLTGRENIKTQEVSNKIGRGKHTTRHVELYLLSGGGMIADTPGFSVLDLPPVKSQELSQFYPDFGSKLEICQFNDCMHKKEVICGIRQAVGDGEIAASRYENYLAILEEIIENERCYR